MVGRTRAGKTVSLCLTSGGCGRAYWSGQDCFSVSDVRWVWSGVLERTRLFLCLTSGRRGRAYRSGQDVTLGCAFGTGDVNTWLCSNR